MKDLAKDLKVVPYATDASVEYIVLEKVAYFCGIQDIRKILAMSSMPNATELIMESIRKDTVKPVDSFVGVLTSTNWVLGRDEFDFRKIVPEPGRHYHDYRWNHLNRVSPEIVYVFRNRIGAHPRQAKRIKIPSPGLQK